MESYLTLLKSYSGRDKVLRTLGYTAVFVSGAFKEGKVHKDLNTIAKQFSQTRTVLRLFDDIPMLFITKANISSKVCYPWKMCYICNNFIFGVIYIYTPQS